MAIDVAENARHCTLNQHLQSSGQTTYTMNDTQYAHYCRDILREFSHNFSTRTEHLPDEDSLKTLAVAFVTLTEPGCDIYLDGPSLVSRLFVTFPDFAPTFPRELLWFFAEECLHFMPDDEISRFQQLDDLRAEAAAAGNVLDMREALANLRGLQ